MTSSIRGSLLLCLASAIGTAPLSAAPDQQEKSRTQSHATRITMDQLEENPRSYIGKPITVEAEVEEILGPRLLAVDSFWVQAAQGNEQLLVVPASPADVKVTAGQTVSIDGVVLQMPAAMRQRAEKAQQGADEIYVFASLVQTAK